MILKLVFVLFLRYFTHILAEILTIYIENYDHNGNAELINIQVFIHRFEDEVVLPGQYTFPFRAKIPELCPSSCYFTGAIDSKASVFYTASAILVPHPSVKVRPMMYTKPFLITQAPYETLSDHQSSSTADIKGFMLFFSKGKATVTTTLSKSSYTTNEDILANIKVDISNCKAKIKHIIVDLRQHVRMKGSFSGTFHQQKSIWKNKYKSKSFCIVLFSVFL